MSSNRVSCLGILGALALLPIAACGSSSSAGPASAGSGGAPGTTGGSSTGGRTAGTGGAPAVGPGSTGGAPSAVGSSGGTSGGSSGGTTGSQAGTGGASSGGAPAGSGGATATGGASGPGGGTGLGGASGTGGATSTGPSVLGTCDPSNLTDMTCLPPEPVLPTGCAKVPAPRTVATAPNDKSAGSKNTLVPESATETLDNAAITAGFAGKSCVELTVGAGGANAFLIGRLELTTGQSLVIDQGVTVFASRNPKSFGATCVVIDPTGAVTDTSVPADAQYDCGGVIMATGDHVSVMGKGSIDGQGGEPLIGVSPPTMDIDTVDNPTVADGTFSWWNVSDFQRHDKRATGSGPGSAPNPALIAVSNATNFVLYGLNLYNSPFFHVQLNSDKFVVWGINLLTPSNASSSGGQALSNYIARNTDGIDPGAAKGITQNGYIVGNRVSTGDDMVAIKGDAQGGANNIVIAHNHFGTGHGLSLGSSTINGITNVHAYDITIDGDVPVDPNTGSSDLNGLRIKSYDGNGGFVKHVLFEDICTRDEAYPIYITASYDANPLVNPAGVSPDFEDITVKNFHQINVNGPQHPFQTTVSVEGDSAHKATVTFENVYVETSTGKKGGPVLTVASTATLTGTMNIGAPPSNDPCTGKTWWPAAAVVP